MIAPGLMYTLDPMSGAPVLEPNHRTWSDFMRSATTLIKLSKGRKGWVETRFVGYDQRISGEGPPLVFASHVNGGPLDGVQVNTATQQEALQQHQSLLTKIATEIDRRVYSTPKKMEESFYRQKVHQHSPLIVVAPANAPIRGSEGACDTGR